MIKCLNHDGFCQWVAVQTEEDIITILMRKFLPKHYYSGLNNINPNLHIRFLAIAKDHDFLFQCGSRVRQNRASRYICTRLSTYSGSINVWYFATSEEN